MNALDRPRILVVHVFADETSTDPLLVVLREEHHIKHLPQLMDFLRLELGFDAAPIRHGQEPNICEESQKAADQLLGAFEEYQRHHTRH